MIPRPQKRRPRRIRRRGLAILTIVAIAGTLCGCGRYGKPKRPTPEPAVSLSRIVTPVAGPAVPSDDTRP